MPINKKQRAIRRAQKQESSNKRVPLQPDGMPQGNHLSGFKGMKSDSLCLCGGCNPKARENRNRPIYI